MTPSLGTSSTPYIEPVPFSSHVNSAPLLSSDACRPCLHGPQPPGVVGKPYPQFSGGFTAVPPSQRSPSACQTQSGSTPDQWRLPSCCPHLKIMLAPSTAHVPHLPAFAFRPFPGSSVPLLYTLPCFHLCRRLPLSPATSESQWWTTVSTTTLMILGNSGSSFVMPISPWKGTL